MRSSVTVLLSACCLAAACQQRPEVREQPEPRTLIGRAARDIALKSETIVVSARVAAGATLASILRAQSIAVSEIVQLLSRIAGVFDLRKVRANQPYRLETHSDGLLRKFEYEIDNDRFLRVSRADDDSLVADVLPIPKTRRVERVTGRIDRSTSSLVAAVEAAGETIELTLALADILGGEIDFSTELQPGDRFDLTVEKQYRDGGAFAGYGPVMAVAFDNDGRRIRAVRFAPQGGPPGYYDEHGVSMKRFFLASPLKFAPVVTSAFTRSRFHPVLREYRAHLGVDYRAPEGAPVVAVSDGLVIGAGFAGASGRLVHLRHANGYESEYLHLSSIAVRTGDRVRQGDLIGRVGSSGVATGPHLDYRLKKDGAFVNPVAAHRAMPPADPVPADDMAAFTLVRDEAFKSVTSLALTRVANENSSVRR
jgi:murein DD-endopeptidase MepM/ murein hydrolase activator NlpD